MKKTQTTYAVSEGKVAITITPPNFKTVEYQITGMVPFVQNKFPHKAREQMREKQELGSQSGKGKKREAKDFDACYKGAMHMSNTKPQWHGIPAPAFRNALISACRLCGFKMTMAKLSLFVEADGFDADDGTPLVKITHGEPHPMEMAVRLATGVADVRVRPMWNEGWKATLRIRFDNDQFSIEDVTNLLARVGLQVGVGEGRPDSRESTGMGWGLFSIEQKRK